jgi:hypothetical protein
MFILGFDIYSVKDLNICERAALSALSDLIGLPQYAVRIAFWGRDLTRAPTVKGTVLCLTLFG